MPIRELYNGKADGKPANIDIVAVHGLNPWNKPDHAYATWRKPDGEKGHLWLRDSLKTVQPNARTALYEYNASPVFETSGRDRFMYEANDFLEVIRIWRAKNPERPLILIGHSLGGILIRQALTHAQDNERYSLIQEKTYALVFFGTPHAGHTKSAKTAFGQAYAKILKSCSNSTSDDLLQALDRHSIFTDNLTERWRHQIDRYKFVFFWSATDEFVARDSAVMELPGGRSSTPKLSGSHSDMCRFDLRDVESSKTQVDRDNYVLVEGNLVELCQGALLASVQERVLKEDTKKEILDGLRLEAANPRWNSISEAYDDTFTWIWKEKSASGPGFIEWLSSLVGVFWITGKPGAGKSTLMKYIYNNAKTMELPPHNIQRSKVLKVSYFFHDQGCQSEKTWSGLLCALLRQLLSKIQQIPEEIESWYNDLQTRCVGGDEALMWPESDLWEAILLVMSRQSDFDLVIIFIDGFDEYEGKDSGSRLDTLMTLLKPNLKSRCVIKIIIASRPLEAIEIRKSSLSHGLKIHEWTNDDIAKYVAARLGQTLALPGLDCSRKKAFEVSIEKFTAIIIQRAFGVFIWVTIAVNNLICGLEDGDTHEELAMELDKLPSELEALYHRIFLRIESIKYQYLVETVNYLRIIETAQSRRTYQPFTLFYLALAVDDFDKTLKDPPRNIPNTEKRNICQRMKQRLRVRCRGLIDSAPQAPALNFHGRKVNQDENTEIFDQKVQYLHLTLHEYLDRHLPLVIGNIKSKFIKDPDVCLMRLRFRLIQADSFPGKEWSSLDTEGPGEPEGLERRTFRETLLVPVNYCLIHANRAEVSTGYAQTKFLDCLKTLLNERDLKKRYTDIFVTGEISPKAYFSDDNMSFLCLAIAFSLCRYVDEKIKEPQFLTLCRPPRSYLSHALKTRRELNLWRSTQDHEDLEKTINSQDNDASMIKTLLDRALLDQKSFKHHGDIGSLDDWNNLLEASYTDASLRNHRAVLELQEILEKFIHAGADPNFDARCNRFEYCRGIPLHSIFKHRIKLINGGEPMTGTMDGFLREFIHHGADPTIKDAKGKSVLDLAEEFDPSLATKNFIIEERGKYEDRQARNHAAEALLKLHFGSEDAVYDQQNSQLPL